MKKQTTNKQAFDMPLKRKQINRDPILGVDADEKKAWVAMISKKVTHPAEFERERDQLIKKTIALLDQEIMAIENNTESAGAEGVVKQTMLGKMAIRLCKGDLKAAKVYLETGKMPRKKNAVAGRYRHKVA